MWKIDDISGELKELTKPTGLYVVGFGGTLRDGSSTERAVLDVLKFAREMGVQTRMFRGPELELPFYAPEIFVRTNGAVALVEALRQADGVVIGSPGYHGGISGLVKNALDYVEDLRDDARPYLHGRAVGVVAAAAGMQGAVTTLGMLRDVTHALRGNPTPFGAAFNSADKSEERLRSTEVHMRLIAEQVVGLARTLNAGAEAPGSSTTG